MKIVFSETRWLVTHLKEVCIPIRLVHLLATASLNKAAFYWMMLKPTFSWAYRYKKTVFTRPISSSGYICSCHHCLCLNLNSHLNLYYRQCLHTQKKKNAYVEVLNHHLWLWKMEHLRSNWFRWSHEGKTPWWDKNPYKKKNPENLPSLFSMLEHNEKATVYKSEGESLLRSQIAWHLRLLEFPASRTVTNEVLLFKPPSLWYFDMAAQAG